MAFLKLSRYKDFGNARKSAAISGLVLIEFITIHNTGKIKIKPNINIAAVPAIFFFHLLEKQRKSQISFQNWLISCE